KLMHIGIKGYQPLTQADANLVFLLDVSGSMSSADKLPLVKRSMQLLLNNLKPTDKVSIVVYAGAAGVVLDPTPVRDKAQIMAALDRLQAGGSTAGGQGLALAYQMAEQNYVKGAVNRIILATDGDFNVGIRSSKELKDYVARKRDNGIFLSILGFGQGNLNDQLMQSLAQNGNGVA
ncbi:MAG: VWA domain-containing protein, partial [Phototrophicales bacterium]